MNIECPFCNTQKFVEINKNFEYINEICSNIKCKREFIIPLNYKKIFLARTFSISETKYKYVKYIKKYFSGVLTFIDALDFGDNKERLDHPETIIPFDINLINKCDMLVAFINQPSFGTLGELYYAKYYRGMPIYVINHNRIHLNDPWLKYIVNGLYTDIDKCYYDLTNSTIREYNMKIKRGD